MSVCSRAAISYCQALYIVFRSLRVLGLVAATVGLSEQAAFAAGPVIRKDTYQERPHFVVETGDQTWWYDIRGGGFSRIIDADGQDWIAFKKEPLSTYPASAAAGYRGLPNCVFVGDDKGAGHPGFDKCTTEQTGDAQVTTTSLSGQWKWRWTFHENYVEFEMLDAGGEPWWFLYEGPIGGTFEPREKYWGTDSLGRTTRIPGGGDKHFGNWSTLYVGALNSKYILAIQQNAADKLDDTYWYLGSSDGGSKSAPDGMVVVGFGRGPNTKPLFNGAGVHFKVALLAHKPWHCHRSTLKAINHAFEE